MRVYQRIERINRYRERIRKARKARRSTEPLMTKLKKLVRDQLNYELRQSKRAAR